MSEIWKPVMGFEELYEVSDAGQVRSLTTPSRVGRVVRKNPKVLRQRDPRKDGYMVVSLYDEAGQSFAKYVHSLVLDAFVGERPSGMEGCHDDDNPRNNCLKNLRWDTPAGNQQDRLSHGTDLRGLKHPKAKLSDAQVREIKARLSAGEKGVRLAEEFDVSTTLISDLKNGNHRGWLEA